MNFCQVTVKNTNDASTVSCQINALLEPNFEIQMAIGTNVFVKENSTNLLKNKQTYTYFVLIT